MNNLTVVETEKQKLINEVEFERFNQMNLIEQDKAYRNEDEELNEDINAKLERMLGD